MLHYKKIIQIIVPFLFWISINSCNEKKEAKQDLSVFFQSIETCKIDSLFNTTIIPRSYNAYKKPIITAITIYKFDTTYNLPNISNAETVDSVALFRMYKIAEFAKKNYVKKEDALSFCRTYVHPRVDCFNKLKVISIESMPKLGRFIKFTLPSEETLFYVPDSSKIYHSYWKSFFSKKNQIKDFWYYKK